MRRTDYTGKASATLLVPGVIYDVICAHVSIVQERRNKMPAKKAKGKAAAQSEDGMRTFLKWLYVLGVLVAGVLGAVPALSHPIVSLILLLIGLAAGFFYHDSADVMNFGLRYLIVGVLLGASAAFFAPVPAVEPYVTGFLRGFFNFLGPVVLAMAIMHFSKKYFGSEM